MEEKKVKTITFDLPGHGADTVQPDEITLKDCVDKVVKIVNEQPGSVILVGHSSSGIVIAQAAEILGKKKVAALVFLDAFLPGNGESVFSLAEKYGPAALGQTLIVSSDHKTVSLNPEKVKELLYDDCSADDIRYAVSRLRPGPLSILATPVTVTENKYGDIEKFYILCTKAKDMEKSKLCRNMPAQVFTLPSSHSPFFSMPDKLATLLLTLPLTR